MNKGMTIQEVENLVKFGSSICVKVTPKVINGEMWVAYRDHETKDPKRAHADLLGFATEIAA